VPSYQDFGLDADPAQLQQDAEDWLLAQAPPGFVIPVWVAWILSAVARVAVEVVVLAGRVPVGIFKTFGVDVLGVQPITAIAATATATFTLTDTLGHTIGAGAQLDVDGVGFETVTDLIVAAGAGSGSVGIVALDAGTAANGVQAPVALVSPTLVFVSTVALGAPTAGGVDDEDDDAYVDRLADTTPALSRKAILINDFATLARDDAEVYRALAIDNLNAGAATGTATTTSGSANLTVVTPTTGWVNGMALRGAGIAAGATIVSGAGTATMVMSAPATASAAGVAVTGDDTNAEGHVTVVVQNQAGAAVSPAGKARVLAAMNANRVLNLVPHVLDPATTSVDVSATTTAYSGYDVAAVDTAATQAIADFMNAARWGNPTGSDEFAWVEETKLRRDDLVWVVHNTPGVRRVDSLTLALHGGGLATADLTLAGPGAIPVLFAGQPNVTVNPS
jgi:hypothetical protein